jgi:hypothetical protein
LQIITGKPQDHEDLEKIRRVEERKKKIVRGREKKKKYPKYRRIGRNDRKKPSDHIAVAATERVFSAVFTPVSTHLCSAHHNWWHFFFFFS